MFTSSYIELSETALCQNINFLNDWIGEDTKFCSVVKGNAYGHGIKTFVPLAEECGVDYFAVFDAAEARRVHEAKTRDDSSIMIMGMISNEKLGWAIENDVTFFVFENDRLQAAIKEAKKQKKPARIHLQIETGMNRLGLVRDELPDLVRLVRKNSDHLIIEGICTHYAGAENISNYLRIKKQIRRFNEAASWLKQQGIEANYYHTACSAAALNYPQTTMDLVRFGIAQYGFWPNRETYMNFVKNHEDIDQEYKDPLKRVMTWKSMVMSMKKVPADEYIGYGTTYYTNREQTIATIPIGYSHGFGRDLTNTGIVLVNGRRATVVGLVNMNLLTVDITDIPDVQKGDEVVIIGKQGDQEISVASFSEMTNHLNYEVLVRIPKTLPRHIITEEGEKKKKAEEMVSERR